MCETITHNIVEQHNGNHLRIYRQISRAQQTCLYEIGKRVKQALCHKTKHSTQQVPSLFPHFLHKTHAYKTFDLTWEFNFWINRWTQSFGRGWLAAISQVYVTHTSSFGTVFHFQRNHFCCFWLSASCCYFAHSFTDYQCFFSLLF